MGNTVSYYWNPLKNSATQFPWFPTPLPGVGMEWCTARSQHGLAPLQLLPLMFALGITAEEALK